MKSESMVASLQEALEAIALLEAVTESLEVFEKHAALKVAADNPNISEEDAITAWRRGEGVPQVTTRKAQAFVVADLRQRIERLLRQALRIKATGGQPLPRVILSGVKDPPKGGNGRLS
jgi:hypothetical protein